ncbi:hypothetical protein ACOJTA_12645 [Malaciobacter sp. WC5094]
MNYENLSTSSLLTSLLLWLIILIVLSFLFGYVMRRLKLKPSSEKLIGITVLIFFILYFIPDKNNEYFTILVSVPCTLFLILIYQINNYIQTKRIEKLVVAKRNELNNYFKNNSSINNAEIVEILSLDKKYELKSELSLVIQYYENNNFF